MRKVFGPLYKRDFICFEAKGIFKHTFWYVKILDSNYKICKIVRYV